MARLGDAASAEGCLLVDGTGDTYYDWTWYFDAARESTHLEGLRSELLATINPKRARAFDAGSLVASIGADFFSGVKMPVGALGHRDIALGYHVDTQMPERCQNVTVFFTQGCSGGELVIDEQLAFVARDLYAVQFDGQRPHGVAPFTLEPGGYRISLTYYFPYR